jgi:hypothetical protein
MNVPPGELSKSRGALSLWGRSKWKRFFNSWLSAGQFGRAGVYLTLIEHPPRMQFEPRKCLKETLC